MRARHLLSLSLLAGLGQAQNTIANNTCATGLYMIVARGSNEPAGAGRIGAVAGNVSESIPGSIIAPLNYPATFDNYTISEAAGVVAMTEAITSHIAACPTANIALIGYSQGAQVTADSLCGSDVAGSLNFTASPELSSAYESNIVAVVMFGDPSHVGHASWNAGTSTRDGIFPRENFDACQPYSSKVRSWCDTGDIYCDSGSVRSVHGSYFANYTMVATDFIIDKFNESQTSANTSGNSTTTNPITTSGSQHVVAGNIQLGLAAVAAWVVCLYS